MTLGYCSQNNAIGMFGKHVENDSKWSPLGFCHISVPNHQSANGSTRKALKGPKKSTCLVHLSYYQVLLISGSLFWPTWNAPYGRSLRSTPAVSATSSWVQYLTTRRWCLSAKNTIDQRLSLQQPGRLGQINDKGCNKCKCGLLNKQ